MNAVLLHINKSKKKKKVEYFKCLHIAQNGQTINIKSYHI